MMELDVMDTILKLNVNRHSGSPEDNQDRNSKFATRLKHDFVETSRNKNKYCYRFETEISIRSYVIE